MIRVWMSITVKNRMKHGRQHRLSTIFLPRFERGDFYIICPDNAVTSEMDAKRILWATQDITENRPALSRWHPDWKAAFEGWMKS